MKQTTKGYLVAKVMDALDAFVHRRRRFKDCRIGRTRTDGIDGDPGSRKIAGQSSHQTDHPVFGRHVGRCVMNAHESCR